MYKKSASGQEFKVRWEKQRTRKTNFVIRMMLIMGLVFGSIMYLINHTAMGDAFNMLHYLYFLGSNTLIGLFVGWTWYRSNEKTYQQILKWEEEEKETEN